MLYGQKKLCITRTLNQQQVLKKVTLYLFKMRFRIWNQNSLFPPTTISWAFNKQLTSITSIVSPGNIVTQQKLLFFAFLNLHISITNQGWSYFNYIDVRISHPLSPWYLPKPHNYPLASKAWLDRPKWKWSLAAEWSNILASSFFKLLFPHKCAEKDILLYLQQRHFNTSILELRVRMWVSLVFSVSITISRNGSNLSSFPQREAWTETYSS